jgi:acetyltransferase
VIALDARVRIARSAVGALERLAIRPYPIELEEQVEHGGRQMLIRPIRPEDTPQHRAFLARIAPQDMYTRFFRLVREFPEVDLAHLTQIDYDREMAFIAVGRTESGEEEILGVARACADPDNAAAEFAVLVRSDLKRKGLGRLLMQKLLHYCRTRGTQRLWGLVLSDNAAMLQLAKSLGFRVRTVDQNVEEIVIDLQPAQAAAVNCKST